MLDKTIKIKDTLNLIDKPANIQMINNIFTQNNAQGGGNGLVALKVDLIKDFKDGKIKIRVNKLKKGSNIYMGAI